MSQLVCKTCVEVHDRDTTSPIQCPNCGELIGCFWHHHGVYQHLKSCKAKKDGKNER